MMARQNAGESKQTTVERSGAKAQTLDINAWGFKAVPCALTACLER